MFKRYLFSAAAFMLTVVALTGVSPRSSLWAYEPDAPDCLKRDL